MQMYQHAVSFTHLKHGLEQTIKKKTHVHLVKYTFLFNIYTVYNTKSI